MGVMIFVLVDRVIHTEILPMFSETRCEFPTEILTPIIMNIYNAGSGLDFIRIITIKYEVNSI